MAIDGRAFRAQLSSLGDAIHNNAIAAMRAAVAAAVADAKATTLYNDRTTLLRSQTDGSVDIEGDGVRGEIHAATKYARFVEGGTRAHVITGRRGGMLTFQINGNWISKRSVNHPGTAPRPFMRHAELVGEQVLDYGLEYYIDFAISKFNALG